MNSSGNPGPSDPESPPAQSAAGAAEIQESSAGASSHLASAPDVPPPEGSELAESADATKKHHLLLPIPSRRSSKADKQSTEKTEEPTRDEPGRRGSKVSLLKVRRDRSRASSRRSRRTEDVANVEKSQETTTPTTPEMQGPAKSQQKKGSKLLSFLSCCSASNDLDEDDTTLAPKQTARRPPVSNRLPSPEKAEAHTGDSSTAESRDPAYFGDEKAITVSADQSQPQEEERSSHVPTDMPDEGVATGVGLPAALESSHDHDDTAVSSNGVIPESKADSQHPVEQAMNEVSTPAEVIPKQPVNGETEGSAHEEEVKQQTIGIPPPPPPPIPPVPEPPLAQEPGEHQQWLLPPPLPHLQNRKCLVLDLDETLVHSSFKVLERADFTIPVEIEGQYHNIYVIKRPGVDQFMKRVGELYEVVVFTASVSKYGDPLLDQLDIHNVVHHRLFRESCYNHQGNYVKDLSQVGRDLRETIIIDNSPTSYIFHPQHAIPISSWFSDAHDNELLDLIPVLEDLAGAQVQDVSMVLDITL
ncbi:hypothetical protein N7462_007386 [Penicillium macrosclerotiorum]|uniref:uncharacterized protein n=1 Tax=Penicillium macrosclerotiorum TaxID=303699 RepID=UPI002547A0EF|nr:uncharacterized protein N7462_007386 [Penicillium macrosclerotiorum]KAJ5679142.1 hypothetical protein N7462_007386 [Penicillium macrosclerotiorum]